MRKHCTLSCDKTYEQGQSIPPANKPVRKKIIVTAALLLLAFFTLMIQKQQRTSFSVPQLSRKYDVHILLSNTSEASVEEITRLIRESADINANYGNSPNALSIAAACSSNPEVLRVLIKEGASINSVDENGWTLLMSAACYNLNPEVLRVLVEEGANVDAVDKYKRTPLMLAANRNSNPEVLRVLIKEGADVNFVGEYGRTPLMLAAQYSPNPEVLRALIEGGADVNFVARDGFTPLMCAAENRDYFSDDGIIRLLIDEGADARQLATQKLQSEARGLNVKRVAQLIQDGADVNAVGKYGWTPLEIAARNNSYPEVMLLLIEKGADVNAVGKDGRTPLILAARNNSNAEVLRVLIEGGADVNAVDEDGYTPLMSAAQNNSNPEVLRVLIEGGADVNTVGVDGRTPLMSAAQNNSNPEVLRVLIEGGADVNFVARNGLTPLMCAAATRDYFSDDGIIRLLIDEGADANAVDRNGRTPLILAAHSASNAEVLRVLIEGGADVNAVDKYGQTPLIIAARNTSNAEVLRVLIGGGADVNAVDKDGRTPLILAVRYKSDPEVLSVLIEGGADVNTVDEDGRTPLILAVRYESDPEVLRVLIEGGADVNAVDKDGWTPLIIAARNNSDPEVLRVLIEGGADAKLLVTHKLLSEAGSAHVERVTWLIQDGADVNAVDEGGRTPLMLAAQNNSNAGVLRVLIENGADVNAIDNYGRSPLIHSALYNSSPGVLRVLLERDADSGIKDKEDRIAFNYAEYNSSLIENLSKAGAGEDVDFDLYNPWSDRAQLPRLEFPASFKISGVSGQYPTLDGATLAYPIYAAVTNEIYPVSDKSDLQQYLNCSKTSSAYNRLINGETDVIFVLQPSDEQLQSAKDAGVELHFTPIAKDAFVFFVNGGNPVSGLTVEQIRDIYREKITNWKDVGGKNLEIAPYQRQENSGSQTAMQKEVMKGEKLPPPILGYKFEGMSLIVLDVAADYQNSEIAIGYSFRFFTEDMMRRVFENRKKMSDYFQLLIDLIPANNNDFRKKREGYQNRIKNLDTEISSVKLLAVDGIEPSVENIRNGTYPFTIYVYAVTTGKSNQRSKELIDWILSPQGQELIEKTGFVGAKRAEY